MKDELSLNSPVSDTIQRYSKGASDNLVTAPSQRED